MTEPIESAGSTPAPEAVLLADRLPCDGQSITAQRALEAPVTVNRAARTVEVVWSTGARARNFVPSLGLITEELDMAPAAVRMEGLRSGRAPVLDAHRRGGARDVLGRVIAARLEVGRGHATLQFSAAEDVEPVWQRIADGTLRAMSVGYRVHRYEQRSDASTGQTIHRAVDWEPYEISIVPVPVDAAAAVRGEAPQGAPATAIEPALPDPAKPEEPTMPETMPEAPLASPPQENPVTTTPATQPAAPPEPTRAAPPAPDLDAIRAEVERAAVERIAGYEPVLASGRGLLADTHLDELRQAAIRDRIAPEVLRGRMWEVFASQGPRPSLPARPETGPGHDDPAALLDAMAEALAARSMPGYQAPSAGPGAGRTSCCRAAANQFRLMLHTGAYWLLWSLRSLMPKRSTWRVAQFDTLRLRLVKLATRVVALKTRVMLHLPSACPDQAILSHALERLPRLTC